MEWSVVSAQGYVSSSEVQSGYVNGTAAFC